MVACQLFTAEPPASTISWHTEESWNMTEIWISCIFIISNKYLIVSFTSILKKKIKIIVPPWIFEDKAFKITHFIWHCDPIQLPAPPPSEWWIVTFSLFHLNDYGYYPDYTDGEVRCISSSEPFDCPIILLNYYWFLVPVRINNIK